MVRTLTLTFVPCIFVNKMMNQQTYKQSTITVFTMPLHEDSAIASKHVAAL
jgi:hypothetical protein